MDLLVFGLLFLSVQAKGQLLNFGGIRDSTIEEITRPCRVPTGKSGFCVKQNQCPYISDLIKNLKKPLPGDVALLIRDSFFCPKVSYKLFLFKTIWVIHKKRGQLRGGGQPSPNDHFIT